MGSADGLTFAPATLQDYTQAVFVGAGAASAVAGRLAASLVLSNQSGHDSTA